MIGPAKPIVLIDRFLPKDVVKLFKTPHQFLRFEDKVYLRRLIDDIRALHGDVEFGATFSING